MTLIELMVAMTLGVMLIALSWSAFIKTKDAANRTSQRVELHTSAALYRELFLRDFSNMSPATAFFARSTPRAPTGSDEVDTVEVVFMRTTAPLRVQFSEGIQQQFMADYHWVRWRFVRTWRQIAGNWTVVDHRLYRSHSSPHRRWQADQTLAGPAFDNAFSVIKPDGANNGGILFVNLPRPLRDASAGIPSLDFNTYNTPAPMVKLADDQMGDIGDWADLERNEELQSDTVRDFLIGWVDARGRSTTVSSDSAADHRLDGLFMDVLGPAGNAYKVQLANRPRIVRITMALGDGKVALDFALSVATPGLPPQFRP